MDAIQRKIEPDVKQLFDELGEPEIFDYIDKIAFHIPFISITRMVGIPEKYWPEIKQVIMTFTETWNPTISDEHREKARQDSNRAIDIIKEVIAERRSAPVQDDFLSTLLKIEQENEGFEEGDIITLILALIGAGADTTLVAQQWSVYCLLKHKDQMAKALATPDAFSNAFSEINRWGTASKMGFARYAPRDMEILGEQVRKGQMVLMMPHLKDYDPEYYDHPEKVRCGAGVRSGRAVRLWPALLYRRGPGQAPAVPDDLRTVQALSQSGTGGKNRSATAATTTRWYSSD